MGLRGNAGMWAGQPNRTYSKSTGWRLMPMTGGAIQPANLPGSTTRPISEATKAKSSGVGSHSALRAVHSASLTTRPSGDILMPASAPIWRLKALCDKVIEKAGLPFRLTVPHKAFHRNIGLLKGVKVAPDGRVISESEWAAHRDNWLPSESDRAFVASLMGRVVDPGKFANWIAPPVMGVNRQPVDFEYVRFA
eukprot:gene41653-55230_t